MPIKLTAEDIDILKFLRIRQDDDIIKQPHETDRGGYKIIDKRAWNRKENDGKTNGK